jgi:hypothetical protein
MFMFIVGGPARFPPFSSVAEGGQQVAETARGAVAVPRRGDDRDA